MKTNERMKNKGKIAVVLASLAIGWLCWGGGSAARAQTPANLSPGLQEVVKLTQAHMGDDVITAYVKNSGQSYYLSADDILYLNSQGVSQGVITALLQSKGAAPAAPTTPGLTQMPVTTPPSVAPATPAPPPTMMPPTQTEVYVPPAPPPPGSPIDYNYFHAQLAPYGGWLDVPPYGPVWRPIEAATLPGWRPYFNGGHWEYTDSGWFWQSDYPYGDIVFHYGRWVRDFRLGWLWVPGYDWAPAWVAWRQADAYAGWAPLPPGAYFEPGVGFRFRGQFGVDFDFGLGYDDFVFVGYDHFWDHDYRPFLAPPTLAVGVFRASLVINNYNFVDGRFVVEGLGHDRIALLTHHEVRPIVVNIRDTRIIQAREVQRTVIINRVQEIQRMPASNPIRRAVEQRDAARPPGVVPRPGEISPRPGETVPRPGEIAPRPGEAVPRPGEVAPRSGEIVPRPGEIAPRAGEGVTRSGEVAPGQYGAGARSSEAGTRGGAGGANPSSSKDSKDTQGR
jgi:hypothetical protein